VDAVAVGAGADVKQKRNNKRRIPLMRKRHIVIVAALSIALLGSIPGVSAEGQKTLAATMDVYVFPTESQDSGQQSKEEAECYNWAVSNTGTDPFQLAKQAEAATQQAEQTKEQAAQSTKGAGASSAVKGAAVGALIGEIADDDPGGGAAWGAAAGVVAGRRKAKRGQQQATQQADQQAAQTQQVTAESLENFKKAFSVCLEAKKYMVKY
jgi:hypothetical protein